MTERHVQMTSDRNDIWKDFSSNDKELLRIIARDVALLVAKPTDKNYFQGQLRLFIEKCKDYEDTLKAYREGTWKSSMGKPPNPYTAIRHSVPSGWKEIVDFISESKHGPAGRKYDRKHGITLPWITKETRLLASYVELAVIHDTVRPEPENLCKDIIPGELFDAILVPYLEKPAPLLYRKPLQPGSYDRLALFTIHFQRMFEYVKADLAENPQETEPARHSFDFRSVHWFGIDYNFTPNQAAAVKMLWEAWENGTPDIGGDTLATKVDSDSRRARDIFKGHPAFGKMICPGTTKGTYRLVKPD